MAHILMVINNMLLLVMILVDQLSIDIMVILLFNVCILINCVHSFRNHDLHVQTIVLLISLHISVLTMLVLKTCGLIFTISLFSG